MRFFIISLLFLYNCSFANIVDFGSHQKKISIKSYKELRDDGIVKQDLDYSCGAASISTLLNNFFYQKTTEEQILQLMDKGDLKASFLDMQKALNTLGFQSQGLAVSYDTLTTLKIPVIVYIKHRKTDHFSVIRGINDEFVWLADPSLGNRILTKYQFMDMWQTRDDKVLSGKILVIMPQAHLKYNPHYFTHHIQQPNKLGLKMLRQGF